MDEEQEDPGPQIQGYRTLRQLGAGGFGRVWLAQNLNDNSKIAIKEHNAWNPIRPSIDKEVSVLQKLSEEPNVPRVPKFLCMVPQEVYFLCCSSDFSS